MTCVAVTRGGWGDFWLFETAQEADLHPLVQYGDAILAEPHDIARKYNVLEIGRFVSKLGLAELGVSILSKIDSELPNRKNIEVVEQYSEQIWERMVKAARKPPVRPVDVFNLVQQDRQLMIQEGHMAAKDKTQTTDGEKTKAERTPRPPKYAAKQRITLLDDKDGKKYSGKDNNPKRAGSKAHTNFSFLKDGMTVEAYVKAVGDQAVAFTELDYCAKKGYLSVADAA